MEKFISRLDEAYNVNFKLVTSVTPVSSCHTCYRSVTRYEGKIAVGESYTTIRKIPVEWVSHSESECKSRVMCDESKAGGRQPTPVYKGKQKAVAVWTEDEVPVVESRTYSFVKSLDLCNVKVLSESFVNCVCVICIMVLLIFHYTSRIVNMYVVGSNL